MSKLTANRVEEIIKDCLFTDGEEISGEVKAEGILHNYAFHPMRLAQHKAEIAEMLAQLPDPFMAGEGGGWSFLNACQDRDGEQWTGLHRTMEHLVCLGIACGLVAWVMPRNMWSILPGGMPYFVVTLAKATTP